MKTDRREFLKYGLITSSLFLGSVYSFNKFKKRKRPIGYSGQWIQASERGHQLRQAINLPIVRSMKQATVIVGGGMSGLIAGYYLKNSGYYDFKIVELNSQAGGNSSYGENSVSKYPWGAHYVPLPNPENTDLLRFFESMGLAKFNLASKRLEFDEEYLCQDPQERLLLKGEWQESLLPSKNISAEDQNQLNRFHQIVDQYKIEKGADGKFVFDIPVMSSSQDPKYLKLDTVSFADYLSREGFNSDVVNWYLNYCTLDDFGMGIHSVSAWAGLHYFCSRRPLNGYDDHKIMTWPQGNGWIMQTLVDQLKEHIVVNQAAVEIKNSGTGSVLTKIYSFDSKEITECESQNLIFSAPHFLIPYVFSDKKNTDQVFSDKKNKYKVLSDKKTKFQVTADDYYSWVVANVTLQMTTDQLHALHWDNVRYGSDSLGYVHARHQELRSHVDNQTVLTLYWPLYEKNQTATEVRKKISKFEWQDWAPRIESELEAIHPGIGSQIKRMDIKIHGHAMIGPRVGRMTQVLSQGSHSQGNDKNIFFAHTDNSGMSLFEEAHYWGHRAAQDILKRV